MSDTPRTDLRAYDVIYRDDIGCIITATDIEQRADGEHVDSDFARTLERENAAMREAIRVSLIRAYTAGYQHGHEATVEGEFIPVHSSDETEFHAENIHHLMHDGSLPELQPFLKP